MGKRRTIDIGEEIITLTDKELLFADHYLCSFNATNAALQAGYSKKCAGQQGHENLKKPEITKYLQYKSKPVLDQLNITRERILKEFATIAFSRLSDFMTKDFSLIGLDKWDPDKAGAIKHIEKSDSGHKITFHDKMGALQKLWDLVYTPAENPSNSEFYEGINNHYFNN